MKFLIDECLHTSLVEVANTAGHEAHHVVYLGLQSDKDWELMPRIVGDEFTFVTNNARDFRLLYRREALHPGFVIIVPQVKPDLQRQVFAEVLEELRTTGDNLDNQALEVSIEDGVVVIDRYNLP